jgi:hypothetical protein
VNEKGGPLQGVVMAKSIFKRRLTECNALAVKREKKIKKKGKRIKREKEKTSPYRCLYES